MKRFMVTVGILTIVLSLCDCAAIYRQQKNKRNRCYDEGMKLYGQGKYKEAYDKFDSVVSIDPEYKRSVEYLNRTKAYLKQKEVSSKLRANQGYVRGVNLLKAKQYEAALDQLLAVREQYPDFPDVDDKIDACREKLQGRYAQTFARAEKQYKAKQYIPAYRTCLYAKRYKSRSLELSSLMSSIESALEDRSKASRKAAEKLYKEKKYEAAKRQCQIALNQHPWDKDAKALLNKVNEAISIGVEYNAGVALYNGGNYFPAFNKFLYVSSKDAKYKDTAGYLDRIKKNLAANQEKYYNTGVGLYEKEDFEKAIAEFNKVLTINPSHKNAQEYKQRAQAKLDIKKSLGGQ